MSSFDPRKFPMPARRVQEGEEMILPLKLPPPAGLVGPSEDVIGTFAYNGADSASLTDINRPLFALGLHGFLPPGSLAIVVPYERRDDLLSYLTVGVESGTIYRPLDTRAFVAAPLPKGAIILHPGEVHCWDKVLANGATAWISCPWSDVSTSIGLHGIVVGPTPTPILRVYLRSDFVPSQIKWVPIGNRIGKALVNTAAPAGTTPLTEARAVLLNSSCDRVVIELTDDDGAYTRIDAAEAGNYEVWWLLQSGVWVHHHDDDFDGDGRGQASDTHYVETYTRPRTAGAVYVRQVDAPATNFHHVVHSYDSESP